MNSAQFKRVFPIGSHLCREPMPSMTELKRDMENLRRHGFNLVKLQESWKADEPEEGKCDFSALRELIEHAESLDMGVYLGLSMEHAPAWLWEKHPGARMVDMNGAPLLYEAQETIPADGKPGPCFDHAGAMEDHLRFIRRLVEELGTYENIVVWNTWQEMGYESERLTGHRVCYCAHTIAAFQDWLRGRFGSLDALNRAWRSRYSRWEDAVPNRDIGRFCLPNNIAFGYFLENERIAGILRRRCEATKAADPLGRPVFAHQGSSTVGSGVDWTYAESQDFLGCSCYPAWFHIHDWDDLRAEKKRETFRHKALLNEMWESVALKFDYLRGCNPEGNPLWGAEFQGGPIATGLYKGRAPDGADLRRWMLTAVGSGASALSFWVSRAEIQGHEGNGYSLLDSAGDSTPRYEEAARVGKGLNRWPELLGRGGTVPRAKAAILVDEWNFRLCRELKGDAEEHLMYSTRGWHRLFWERGVPVDFVSAEQLGEPFVDDYSMLVAPFPLSLSADAMAGLRGYVERGGNLISEACPGRFDRWGYATRGELPEEMTGLFGTAHGALTMVEEPEGGARWRMHELSWGDYAANSPFTGAGLLAGCSLRPNLYVQRLSPSSAETVMTLGGDPVATRNAFGKGTAWLLGTFPGHGGTAYACDENRRTAARLMELCGAAPAHDGRLLLRIRTDGQTEARFYTNPTAQRITERIPVPDGKTLRSLTGEEIPVVGGGTELTVDSLDVVGVMMI